MLKNNNNNKIVKSFNPATSSNCCPKNKSFNHLISDLATIMIQSRLIVTNKWWF